MSLPSIAPLTPDTREMARQLKVKRITAKNVIPAPGYVLCRIPQLSESIIVPSALTSEGEPGAAQMRPIEILAIGKPKYSPTLGTTLPPPWFKVGDFVYTSGAWAQFDHWEDDSLVLIAPEHILARYTAG